jgi:hypothetical protein
MLAGIFAVALYYRIGEWFFDGYLLDLGSISRPAPRYVRFVASWSVFGSLAAAFFALGLARLTRTRERATAVRQWSSASMDGLWMLLGSAAGLLIPLALRVYLLDGAPLTDDESAYRFMAELLASGRLRVHSPPLKLFFDNIFMVNDGSLYAGYFLGWPALMVPGVWLGAVGMMNAVYSAATVPALFLVARRLAGSAWAKVAVVVYLASPMLMVAAATELSHTSCLMALAWTTWFVLRSRDACAPPWVHAGVAFCFSVAFFIRPSAAVGIGTPVVLWWLAGVRMQSGRRRAIAVAAFALPALLMGGMFLLADKAQTGAFTVTPYSRLQTYMEENGYRFAGHIKEEVEFVTFKWDRTIPTVPFTLAFALFRLNWDLFGWPCSLLFAIFGARRSAWWIWLSLPTFALLHALLVPLDIGVDSFGPTHYFELAWPILLLTVLGLRAVSEESWVRRVAGRAGLGGAAFVPAALVGGLLLVSCVGYLPVRFGALARIADNINMPRDAVASAQLHNALVFAPRPFAPNCRSDPTEHFVLFRPNNDPDLRSDVLWANHINPEQDRRLLGKFPGRQGYVLWWVRPCNATLVPLDQLQPGTVPDAAIGDIGHGPV